MRVLRCLLFWVAIGGAASAAECRVQYLPSIDFAASCETIRGGDAIDKNLHWTISGAGFSVNVLHLGKDYSVAELNYRFRGEKAVYRSERLIVDGRCLTDGALKICTWKSGTPKDQQQITTRSDPTGLPLPVVEVNGWCRRFAEVAPDVMSRSGKKSLCIQREQEAYDLLKQVWGKLDDEKVKSPCLFNMGKIISEFGYGSAQVFAYENLLECAYTKDTAKSQSSKFKE